MTGYPVADPTEQSRWRRLRLLQAAMDADIARIYTEAQVSGLRPSYVMELLRLHARGPMTITELAESVQRTHSATSQKVAAMRAAGLVRTTTGTDARSKAVTLTARARRIAGLLAAEWRATEAAVADLEAEIPYPLSRVVTDIEEALARKSFHDRIAEKLADDDAWGALCGLIYGAAGQPRSGARTAMTAAGTMPRARTTRSRGRSRAPG